MFNIGDTPSLEVLKDYSEDLLLPALPNITLLAVTISVFLDSTCSTNKKKIHPIRVTTTSQDHLQNIAVDLPKGILIFLHGAE